MMNFRYDFGEKLDLTKFVKQAVFYISLYPTEYTIFTKDYKLVFKTFIEEGVIFTKIHIFDIHRNTDNTISGYKSVFSDDSRLESFKEITSLFLINRYEAFFTSTSSKEVVDKLSLIIKVIHKINNLKAFL